MKIVYLLFAAGFVTGALVYARRVWRQLRFDLHGDTDSFGNVG